MRVTRFSINSYEEFTKVEIKMHHHIRDTSNTLHSIGSGSHSCVLLWSRYLLVEEVNIIITIMYTILYGMIVYFAMVCYGDWTIKTKYSSVHRIKSTFCFEKGLPTNSLWNRLGGNSVYSFFIIFALLKSSLHSYTNLKFHPTE